MNATRHRMAASRRDRSGSNRRLTKQIVAACARGGRRTAAWSLIPVFAALAAVATAAEHSPGAHVHGVSRLNIAVDGTQVEIELEAPGSDIVGFEHMAETDADKAAVTQASAALKAGERLFAFPADAGCRLESAEVESPMIMRKNGQPKDHGRGGEGDPQDGRRHTEFHAHYLFHCDRPEKLTRIDARNFFARFPAVREIEIQAITPSGQRAGELTPTAATWTF